MSDESERGEASDAAWILFALLGKVRLRFRDYEGVDKPLVDLMMMFVRGEIALADLRVQVVALLEDHQDLIDIFDSLPWEGKDEAAAAGATEGEREKVSEPRPKKKITKSAMSDETEREGGKDEQGRALFTTSVFLAEASSRFPDFEGVYKRLTDLLVMFHGREITKADLRVQVAALLEGHQDLLDHFDRLPWDTMEKLLP